ncbi:MAG: hypothetical protein ACREPI_02405, partial [Candidatus Dormibacterales bacterium]
THPCTVLGRPARQREALADLVTTRILDRRRLVEPGASASRRRPRGLPGGLLARSRLDAFGAVYAVLALIAGCLVVYLLVVAQATKASYEIGQLRGQQAQLLAEQQQLRYQEASLTAPARIEQEAAAAGMQRATPSRYVSYRPVRVDVGAPLGRERPAGQPLWQQVLAALARGVGARGLASALAGR